MDVWAFVFTVVLGVLTVGLVALAARLKERP